MNPLTFVPADLDYVDAPAYCFATDAVFKYASMRKMVPYREWPAPASRPSNPAGNSTPRRCPPRHAATPDTPRTVTAGTRSAHRVIDDLRLFTGAGLCDCHAAEDALADGGWRTADAAAGSL